MKKGNNHTNHYLIKLQKKTFKELVEDTHFTNKLRNFVRSKCGGDSNLINDLYDEIIEVAIMNYWCGKKLLNKKEYKGKSIRKQMEGAIFGVAIRRVPKYFKKLNKNKFVNLSSIEWEKIAENTESGSEDIYPYKKKFYKGFEKTLKKDQPLFFSLLREGKSNKEIEKITNRTPEAVRTAKNKIIVKLELYKKAVLAFEKYGEKVSRKNLENLSKELSIKKKTLSNFFNCWNNT